MIPLNIKPPESNGKSVFAFFENKGNLPKMIIKVNM